MDITTIRKLSLEYAKGNVRTAPKQKAAKPSRDNVSPPRVRILGEDKYDLLSAADFIHARHGSVGDGRLTAEYRAYMNSDPWKAFRLSIIAERGRLCERCGKPYKRIELHHLHYRNFGHELPEDVKLACVRCHKVMDRERRRKT